ncbi:MAG: SDR family oxidoreductase [Anaerolineae bacterium]|nr:SDR family oxidoreductase [Anaerolineae bacterium]
MRKDLAKPLLAAGLGFLGIEVAKRVLEPSLRGQVALITGGSRGLGYLIARQLADEGCLLAVCARDERELAQAREDLEQQGAVVLAVQCDVSSRAQVDRLIESVIGHYGRLDILVNNAGIIQVGPIQTMTHQDFAQALDVMLWGLINTTLAALPYMQERHSGRIVNITSIGGKVSVPHLLPYNTAKFAATGFSEGLRAELAQYGISVTTVNPGLMRTGSFMNANLKGQTEREYLWFALGDNMPFISMDAERAAHLIVEGAKRSEAQVILTLPAHILARIHGLFPGTTAHIMAIVNRFMPSAQGGTIYNVRGMEVHQRVRSPLLATLIGWGLSAAKRFHQYPGPMLMDDELAEVEHIHMVK